MYGMIQSRRISIVGTENCMFQYSVDFISLLTFLLARNLRFQSIYRTPIITSLSDINRMGQQEITGYVKDVSNLCLGLTTEISDVTSRH